VHFLNKGRRREEKDFKQRKRVGVTRVSDRRRRLFVKKEKKREREKQKKERKKESTDAVSAVGRQCG
jgi:hypothetical protein